MILFWAVRLVLSTIYMDVNFSVVLTDDMAENVIYLLPRNAGLAALETFLYIILLPVLIVVNLNIKKNELALVDLFET